MTNPVEFIDDLHAKLARLERDLKLCQRRFDELQSSYEHALREAELREAELRIENNNLRSAMRETAGALSELLDVLK